MSGFPRLPEPSPGGLELIDGETEALRMRAALPETREATDALELAKKTRLERPKRRVYEL